MVRWYLYKSPLSNGEYQPNDKQQTDHDIGDHGQYLDPLSPRPFSGIRWELRWSCPFGTPVLAFPPKLPPSCHRRVLYYRITVLLVLLLLLLSMVLRIRN